MIRRVLLIIDRALKRQNLSSVEEGERQEHQLTGARFSRQQPVWDTLFEVALVLTL